MKVLIAHGPPTDPAAVAAALAGLGFEVATAPDGTLVSVPSAAPALIAFARAVDSKSPFTRGHSDRVKGYALALSARLGLSAAEVETLRRGALVHDIGKVAVPDAVLNKPGALTAMEQAVVRGHPVEGARLIDHAEGMRDVLPLVRWHHERMDGNGYPDHIAGDQIPLLVRVLSVADVFDALSSDRPYRAALAPELALAILRKDAVGGGLDPELVEEFCALPSGELDAIGSGGRSAVRTPPPMLAARPALART